ncbi:MAG: GPR endopeptidase [Eubacterium sp.]|nr:GPR endopeptidase [Eubacterium sp.]
MMEIRTDLALETKERFEKDNVEIKGVVIEEEKLDMECKLTTVKIETENGAKIMGKPKGSYITLDAPEMTEDDEEYRKYVANEFAEILRTLFPRPVRELSVLVVGLGNRDVTPDSLGPRVVDQISMNRHLVKEFGKDVFGWEEECQISGMVPGVMAQTGMESQEIILGVMKETKPNLVIVVDALAARSAKRLNRTIQVSDAGIAPGSGVGNHRQAINKESLGVPVISVGIPMVVDAVTIVNDTMWNLLDALSSDKRSADFCDSLKKFHENEKQELIRELLSPGLNSMFVTPKDVDESVRRVSRMLASGIEIALGTAADEAMAG